MSQSTYEITIKPAGRTVFVNITGDLDNAAPDASEFVQKLLATKCRRAIIDLRKVNEMDKHGLRWLADVRELLEQGGLSLRVVVAETGGIRRILTLMQYDRFLTLMSSALKAWRPGKPKRHKQRRSMSLMA